MRQARILAIALGSTAVLVGAVLPLSNVSAHWCRTPLTVHPADPNNADTGCDGTSCPANSGTLPHEHENWAELEKCRNPAPKRFSGWSRGGRGGGPPLEGFDAGLCWHANPHSHSYSGPGSETLVGAAFVFDENSIDCNGDGVPGDFDGDYETGVGGAFFGSGPWANDAVCQYGLRVHGPWAHVNDIVFGADVWFTIGADDTSGPAISTDPVTGETTCETDGSIAPCPSGGVCGPTDDPDDCMTDSLVGSGVTCGYGGDGGYWVFLERWTAGNPPTGGTITA